MEPTSTGSTSGTNGNKSTSDQKSEPTEPIDRSEISPPRSPTGKDECYLMLAQVNLLRIRKQSEPAIELCETALRKWPYRADAHALLGDLYQELERTDDAILRYCRALELEPASKPYRKKLADTVRVKRQSLGPSVTAAPRVRGLRMDRVARAVILSLATLMLVTIMLAPLIFQHRKLSADAVDPSTTVDQKINLNPIILQPATPVDMQRNTDALSSTATPVIRDPVEQVLVDLMGNDKLLLQLGIQVLDAQEDPISNGFSITFLDRPTTDADESKVGILRDALAVAQSASARFGSRDVRQFTIRCLLLSSISDSASAPTSAVSGTTALVFVGTIQRSAVPADDVHLDGETPDELQIYFTEPWWDSSVQ